MALPLLIETTGSVAALFGIASGAKAFATVARTWIEQASRTRRLAKALEDSKPDQRPEIIRACSRLEGGLTIYTGPDAGHEGTRHLPQAVDAKAGPRPRARTFDK